MRATLLIRRRVVLAEDAFAEVVIWQLPEAIPPSPHRFKYRLAYVVQDLCVIRFDNERGKGDHQHVGALEMAYRFQSPEQLMQDFQAAIARWNHEHRHS